MTAAEITLGAAVCVLWAVFLILSAIGTVVTHKDAKKKAAPVKQSTQEDPLVAGEPDQQAAPTGKPLDLKNRNKQPEPEKAEQAAGELVPGRDFDPDTGEVFENGQPVDDQQTTTGQQDDNNHKVVNIGQRAAQA